MADARKPVVAKVVPVAKEAEVVVAVDADAGADATEGAPSREAQEGVTLTPSSDAVFPSSSTSEVAARQPTTQAAEPKT
jgi:hypothetical protein